MKVEITTAIIAGTAALTGVILSQAISVLVSFLDKRHQRRIMLRQKYEELMFYFSASLGWFSEVNNARTRSHLYELAQSPDARNALALSLLYFPELEEAANQYVFAQAAYYEHLVRCFRSGAPANAVGQAGSQEGYKQACDGLMQAKVVLENIIVVNAKKYAAV